MRRTATALITATLLTAATLTGFADPSRPRRPANVTINAKRMHR